MTLHVLLFYDGKRIVGQPRIQVQLGDQATVEDLKRVLYYLYPELSSIRDVTLAVNGDRAEDHTPLNDGDEVAFIPLRPLQESLERSSEVKIS